MRRANSSLRKNNVEVFENYIVEPKSKAAGRKALRYTTRLELADLRVVDFFDALLENHVACERQRLLCGGGASRP